jgi:hypothetical protein
MRRIALVAFLFALPAMGQTVFNCSAFASSGACGVAFIYPLNENFAVFGSTSGSTPALVGSTILLEPTGADHTAINLNYAVGKVTDTAFTSTFTFVPNGQNVTWNLENDGLGDEFNSGAGCEGGFYQGYFPPYGDNAPVTNIFAVEFDSFSYLNSTPSFSYSSVQVYQQYQSPCNPNDGAGGYFLTNKISTSPVPLNSPAGTQNTSTGDTYQATVAYDGSTVTVSLTDLTTGGSCPGSSCFTNTWSNVSIPSLVDGTTAYVGIASASGVPSSYPLYIDSFSFANVTPTGTVGSTVTSGGAPTAANPTFSPAAGTYSGTQSVTLSSSTSGSYICYMVAPAGQLIMPLPNNQGQCAVGTLYSGPVSVAASNTLYATAGTTTTTLPSGFAQAPYVITGGSATPAVPLSLGLVY